MPVYLVVFQEDENEKEVDHEVIKTFSATPSDAQLQEALTTFGIHNDLESRFGVLDGGSVLMDTRGHICELSDKPPQI